jgi:hypothetical protein
MMMVDLDDC